jgi:hypothetical protein
MASSGKKRTTMAKLNREARLRERRAEKVARKVDRKFLAENPPPEETAGDEFTDADELSDSEPSPAAAATNP